MYDIQTLFIFILFFFFIRLISIYFSSLAQQVCDYFLICDVYFIFHAFCLTTPFPFETNLPLIITIFFINSQRPTMSRVVFIISMENICSLIQHFTKNWINSKIYGSYENKSNALRKVKRKKFDAMFLGVFFTSNLIYFLIDIRVAFIIFRKRTRRIPRHASDFKEF